MVRRLVLLIKVGSTAARVWLPNGVIVGTTGAARRAPTDVPGPSEPGPRPAGGVVRYLGRSTVAGHPVARTLCLGLGPELNDVLWADSVVAGAPHRQVVDLRSLIPPNHPVWTAGRLSYRLGLGWYR